MKVGSSRSTGILDGPGRSRAGAAAPVAASAPPVAAAVADTAGIMDIPEAELTPKVRDAIMALLGEVARLREELRQTAGRIVYLERLADEDSLVPVINRRAFVRELSRMMSFAERYESHSSVLYFDLDDLKSINDTHGHAAGDAALSKVALILAEQIRESDIVGRLGGDEFGVILAQADQAQAQQKAASLAAVIKATPFEWRGQPIALRVSYGAHAFAGDDTADDVIDAADRAMYGHKRAANGGRGTGAL